MTKHAIGVYVYEIERRARTVLPALMHNVTDTQSAELAVELAWNVATRFITKRRELQSALIKESQDEEVRAELTQSLHPCSRCGNKTIELKTQGCRCSGCGHIILCDRNDRSYINAAFAWNAAQPNPGTEAR